MIVSAKDNYGVELSEEQAKKLVSTYREMFWEVKQYWKDTERAAKQAVNHPGATYTAGTGVATVAWFVKGSYLWARLPSGRHLCFPAPRIIETTLPWTNEDGTPAKGTAIEISTVDSQTRKWVRRGVYGGLLVENVTQALARDIMAASMLRVDSADYVPILTVHDEIIAEAPVGFGSLDAFCALMEQRPKWADGLPIAVEGKELTRYRK